MSSKMRRFVNRLRAELDIVLIRGGGGYSLSLNRCNLVSLSGGFNCQRFAFIDAHPL